MQIMENSDPIKRLKLDDSNPLRWRSNRKPSPRREYPDCQHFALKEVSVEEDGDDELDFEMTEALMQYLLKNAVVLEKLIIPWSLEAIKNLPTTLLQDNNNADKLLPNNVYMFVQ